MSTPLKPRPRKPETHWLTGVKLPVKAVHCVPVKGRNAKNVMVVLDYDYRDVIVSAMDDQTATVRRTGLMRYIADLKEIYPADSETYDKAPPDGVKILRSGTTKAPARKKRYTGVCQSCQCRFSFAEDKARVVSNSREGTALVIDCPECKNEIWITP